MSEREQRMTLSALQKVLQKERETTAKQKAKHRLVEENFERLKAAWLEGGLEKMTEVYEEIARTQATSDPPAVQ